MIKRIQQEHPWGCQVAVLAMIMGITYREALEYYTDDPTRYHGCSQQTLETILVEQGYAWARKFKFRSGFQNEKRHYWPPYPFADIHWCQVTTNMGAHAVLMLKDGTVLDPWDETRRCLRHPDYLDVNFVAAITKF